MLIYGVSMTKHSPGPAYVAYLSPRHLNFTPQLNIASKCICVQDIFYLE